MVGCLRCVVHCAVSVVVDSCSLFDVRRLLRVDCCVFGGCLVVRYCMLVVHCLVFWCLL